MPFSLHMHMFVCFPLSFSAPYIIALTKINIILDTVARVRSAGVTYEATQFAVATTSETRQDSATFFVPVGRSHGRQTGSLHGAFSVDKKWSEVTFFDSDSAIRWAKTHFTFSPICLWTQPKN